MQFMQLEEDCFHEQSDIHRTTSHRAVFSSGER